MPGHIDGTGRDAHQCESEALLQRHELSFFNDTSEMLVEITCAHADLIHLR